MSYDTHTYDPLPAPHHDWVLEQLYRGRITPHAIAANILLSEREVRDTLRQLERYGYCQLHQLADGRSQPTLIAGLTETGIDRVSQ